MWKVGQELVCTTSTGSAPSHLGKTASLSKSLTQQTLPLVHCWLLSSGAAARLWDWELQANGSPVLPLCIFWRLVTWPTTFMSAPHFLILFILPFHYSNLYPFISSYGQFSCIPHLCLGSIPLAWLPLPGMAIPNLESPSVPSNDITDVYKHSPIPIIPWPVRAPWQMQ